MKMGPILCYLCHLVKIHQFKCGFLHFFLFIFLVHVYLLYILFTVFCCCSNTSVPAVRQIEGYLIYCLILSFLFHAGVGNDHRGPLCSPVLSCMYFISTQGHCRRDKPYVFVCFLCSSIYLNICHYPTFASQTVLQGVVDSWFAVCTS